MFDIDPFVEALSTRIYSCGADTDCSGVINNFDIDAFIEIVTTGGCVRCGGDDIHAVLTELCWRGATLDGDENSTSFQVVVLNSKNGAPGQSVCGPYEQSAGTLIVESALTGRLIDQSLPEREYHASHAECTIVRERCYWIEISNTSLATTWLWEFSGSGNGRAWRDGVFTAGDFAFCLGDDLETDNICTEP